MILYGKIASVAIGKKIPLAPKLRDAPEPPAAGEPGGFAERRRDPFPRAGPHCPRWIFGISRDDCPGGKSLTQHLRLQPLPPPLLNGEQAPDATSFPPTGLLSLSCRYCIVTVLCWTLHPHIQYSACTRASSVSGLPAVATTVPQRTYYSGVGRAIKGTRGDEWNSPTPEGN